MSHRRICKTCKRPYRCPGEPVDLGDAGIHRYRCSVCDADDGEVDPHQCEDCYDPNPKPAECPDCDRAVELRQDEGHIEWTGESEWKCDDCWQGQAERAHERAVEAFRGGTGPLTPLEQQQAAWRLK